MKTINTLTPETIAKIAAGEVVDRPASIVKELIENALDAGATHIDIQLIDGGTRKISVHDNGKGMSKEDIEICYLPHTTSKITTDHDLLSILSFGFRGEALSSIASVCTLTIKSREQSAEHGHIIQVNFGQPATVEPCGMPIGTEVSIDDLFSQIPARKKFLATPTLELRTMTDLITTIALAFPHCGFTLGNNKKNIITLPPTPEKNERITSLLGPDFENHLMAVQHQNTRGSISGFIGTPQSARSSASHQYLFINNRPLAPRLFSKLITDIYGSLIEPRYHSVFIIHLTIPTSEVDINIHPRKAEVALAHKQDIENLIREAIEKTLTEHHLTYTVKARDFRQEIFRDRTMDPHTADFLKNIVSPWNLKSNPLGEIIQINNLYLVASTDQGLLLVDQHAAHERILYEQFKESLINLSSTIQPLPLATHQIVTLSVSDAVILESELPTFTKLGFEIESFGPQTFKINAVPEILTTKNPAHLIIQVIEDIRNGRQDHIEHITHRTLSFLACRAAIKAGDPLDQAESQRLIEKLLSLTTPYTCPHGRPTHIELSLKELDTLFKRH